jgi:hypothetical protein
MALKLAEEGKEEEEDEEEKQEDKLQWGMSIAAVGRRGGQGRITRVLRTEYTAKVCKWKYSVFETLIIKLSGSWYSMWQILCTLVNIPRR